MSRHRRPLNVSSLIAVPRASDSTADVRDDPKGVLNQQRLRYIEPNFSEMCFILLNYLKVGYPTSCFWGHNDSAASPFITSSPLFPHLPDLRSFSSSFIFSRLLVCCKRIMERKNEEGYSIVLSQKIPQFFRVKQTHIPDLNYRKRGYC